MIYIYAIVYFLLPNRFFFDSNRQDYCIYLFLFKVFKTSYCYIILNLLLNIFKYFIYISTAVLLSILYKGVFILLNNKWPIMMKVLTTSIHF